MSSQPMSARSPAHPDPVRRQYDRMIRGSGAHSRFIARESGRVHVVEGGDGPPVVQLHGNNTSSLSHLMLLDQMRSVHTYLVDRPGFGLSDPDDFGRDGLRAYAVRFIDEVLDQLNLESAVLVGASGGGNWALWYSLDRPPRVRGLVLLGSAPLLSGATIPAGLRVMATPLGRVLGRTMKPGRRMLVRMMSSVGEAETIVRHPDLLESLVEAAHDPVATAANAAEFAALLSPLGTRAAVRIRPDDLRRISVPTLMIWGDRDPVVSVAHAKAAAESIPNARLVVLPAGHVPQLGHPARVGELLATFAHETSRE